MLVGGDAQTSPPTALAYAARPRGTRNPLDHRRRWLYADPAHED